MQEYSLLKYAVELHRNFQYGSSVNLHTQQIIYLKKRKHRVKSMLLGFEKHITHIHAHANTL